MRRKKLEHQMHLLLFLRIRDLRAVNFEGSPTLWLNVLWQCAVVTTESAQVRVPMDKETFT